VTKKRKNIDEIKNALSTGKRDFFTSNTTMGTMSIDFNNFGSATGAMNVVNTWNNNVSSSGNIIVTKQNYTPKEIITLFSSSASHRRKFKTKDIFKSGVYILYKKNVVVYVGESINPYQRICTHQKSDKDFDCFRILYCKKNRRKYWEKKLINAYLPQYNKTNKKIPQRNVYHESARFRTVWSTPIAYLSADKIKFLGDTMHELVANIL
tara:strand:+ start:649 stop:1275 length:627 start_codon:yes stop_codon:yes gene_type:complete